MRSSTALAPKPSIWKIAWDWIVEHILNPIFSPVAHALGASKDVGTVVGFAVIALAIGVLVFVAFRLVLAFAPSFSRSLRDGPNVTDLGRSGTSTDWLAAARERAARGDFRRAIGALFSAALAVLDDANVVPFDPARTPGEYRRVVRRERAPASAAFDELTDRFVCAAFAERAPSRDDFEAAERALGALEPLVRS